MYNLRQYGCWPRFLFWLQCLMDPGIDFNHLFVGIGRLGAEIWILRPHYFQISWHLWGPNHWNGCISASRAVRSSTKTFLNSSWSPLSTCKVHLLQIDLWKKRFWKYHFENLFWWVHCVWKSLIPSDPQVSILLQISITDALAISKLQFILQYDLWLPRNQRNQF